MQYLYSTYALTVAASCANSASISGRTDRQTRKRPLQSGTIGVFLICLISVSGVNQKNYLFAFSQLWLPTVQEVLHADWQEVWHSPHPPFFMDSFKVLLFKVFTCFISLASYAYNSLRLYHMWAGGAS